MGAAAAPVNDFGQLFLGFNFFILVATLFLVAVFSGMTLERRRRELGLLLALGYTRASLRRLVLLELGLMCLIGAVLGLGLSIGVAALLLEGLLGTWRDAVGAIELPLVVVPLTVIIGGTSTWCMGMLAAWAGARSTVMVTAWKNLRGQGQALEGKGGLLCRSFGGLVWCCWSARWAWLSVRTPPEGPRPPWCFGCGAAVLVGALCLVWAWLREPAATASVGLSQLGVAGLRLRPTSSFAIISCLSVGLFLVGGIGGGTLQPRPTPWTPRRERVASRGSFDLPYRFKTI